MICFSVLRLYSWSLYNNSKTKEMSKISIILSLIVSFILLQCAESALAPTFIDTFRNAELQKHNEFRSLHGSLPLKLNDTLNSYAQTYAQYLASRHMFGHSAPAQAGKYGENLYWRWGMPTVDYIPGTASTNWYSQEQYYDYLSGQSKYRNRMIGHFTAMVWRSVTDVGFGYAQTIEDGGQAAYIVANYGPTPNIIGLFPFNVFPKNE